MHIHVSCSEHIHVQTFGKAVKYLRGTMYNSFAESAVSEQLTVAAGVRQPLSPGAVSLEEELKKTTSASGMAPRTNLVPRPCDKAPPFAVYRKILVA